MTSNNDPWAQIPRAPARRFSTLRVEVESNHNLFWFRDEANRPGLLVEISRNVSPASLKEAKVNIRDISVDVVSMEEEGLTALIVRLEKSQNRDVFEKLCRDLVDRVTSNDENGDPFSIICQRLKKWQSLLSGKTNSLLSAKEVQGLYAELYFITEMLTNDNSRETALIKGWEGPERTHQDFILDDMAVEIKSLAGNQRGKVRISSEDQLDTHLGRLYLCVYFLSEMQYGEDAESLNDIVRRLSAILTRQESRDLFEMKLEAARYIDIPDYDSPYFRVKDRRTYLVSEGFPRVTRKSLPDGVEAVAYDLVLARIEPFKITTMG